MKRNAKKTQKPVKADGEIVFTAKEQQLDEGDGRREMRLMEERARAERANAREREPFTPPPLREDILGLDD